MVCLSINPYVVTSSPYVFQSLCYSHKVHMTWIQLLPTYLIPKPLLVHSVFFQAQMLTQWWPGVWPFNLPSCLSLSVSVIPQHFSWDKECCWLGLASHDFLVHNKCSAKTQVCFLLVFRDSKTFTLASSSFFFFYFPNSSSNTLWRKILNDSGITPTALQYGHLLPSVLLAVKETSLFTESSLFLGRSALSGFLMYSCWLTCVVCLLCAVPDFLMVFSFGVWWKNIVHLIFIYHPISLLLLCQLSWHSLSAPYHPLSPVSESLLFRHLQSSAVMTLLLYLILFTLLLLRSSIDPYKSVPSTLSGGVQLLQLLLKILIYPSPSF